MSTYFFGVCMCVHMYIQTYTHTHTINNSQSLPVISQTEDCYFHLQLESSSKCKAKITTVVPQHFYSVLVSIFIFESRILRNSLVPMICIKLKTKTKNTIKMSNNLCYLTRSCFRATDFNTFCPIHSTFTIIYILSRGA